jgi:hypothetical protein
VRAKIFRNGIRFEVGPNGIVLPGNNNFHLWGQDCLIGLGVGNVPPLGGSVAHTSPPREEFNHAPPTEPQVMRIFGEHLAPLNADVEVIGEET